MKGFFILLFLITNFPIHSATFFKFKKRSNEEKRKNLVVVEGGTFVPDVIGILSNKESIIHFSIRDDELCKEKIIIKGLGVEIPIKVGQDISIKVKAEKPGNYHFECETGAFCGVLVVAASKGDEPSHYYAPHPD